MRHKKVLIVSAIGVVLFVFLFGVRFCSLPFTAVTKNYTSVRHTGDGFDYLIRERDKKTGVCAYTYDPAGGNDTVVIPAAYEGSPVTGMGGYIGRGGPCPFHIDVEGLGYSVVVGQSEDSFDWYAEARELEVVYYDLGLNIGPDIRQIYAEQGAFLSGGRLYLVRVYVDCDPGNCTFYSENGVLYRKNGERVDGFLYWDQSYTGALTNAAVG